MKYPNRYKKGHIPWHTGKTKKEFPQLSNMGRKKGFTAWNKGKKLTKEHKKNISEAMKGNIGYWTNKKKGPHSEETKEKISIALKKSIQKNSIHKEKILKNLNRQGFKGKKLSEEHRKKIGDSLRGRTISEEQKKFLSDTRKGSNNPAWINDRSKIKKTKTRTPVYEINEWRKKIFKRDNFTCQVCHQKGGNLNAHHIRGWIDYPDDRFDVNNGITLCVYCHKYVHDVSRNILNEQ